MPTLQPKITRTLLAALTATIVAPTSLQALSTNEVKVHVQIAFMWTPERESNYGGKSQVIANMRQSWGISNRAHDSSNTGMAISYVPRDSAVNYTANSGNQSIIFDLRDGGVPGANDWWNQSGADVKGLNGQMSAAGLAFRGDPRQYAVKFLTGPASAHELGHTFGLGHGGVGSGYEDGNGDTPYAGGWATRKGGTRRGTIMTGGQIGWYSTPELTFNGEATGIPNVKDSTRRIRETRLESSRIKNVRPEWDRGGQWWYIRNVWSNLYVTLASKNSNNGTKLVQKDERGNYSQWRFDNAGIGGGWLTSRNRGSGKAIDMTGNPGRQLHQWGHNAGNPNQRFKLDWQDNGFVRLRFANGNQVLDNSGRRTNSGNPIKTYPWNGAESLQWYLEREH